MVKSASRRALLYWLFLLLPTLAAGVGALWLLHREQLRIDEQARAAVETRKTAVQDRSRLIAENIEVLVSDVQHGLMTTLREAPSDGPGTFLTNWKNSNPLVRDVFQSTNDGRIRWGDSNDAVAIWLKTTPWNIGKKNIPPLPVTNDVPPSVAEQKSAAPAQVKNDLSSSKEIASNAYNYQNNRNLLQNISSLNGAPLEVDTQSSIRVRKADTSSSLGRAPADMLNQPQPLLLTGQLDMPVNETIPLLGGVPQQTFSPEDLSTARITTYQTTVDSKKSSNQAPAAQGKLGQSQAEMQRLQKAIDQTQQDFQSPDFSAGWMPWLDQERVLHLFGWRLCDNGTVLVVEVNLPILATQLGQVLPEKIPTNEAYSLRLNSGVSVHEVGFWAENSDQPRLAPARKVPLSADGSPVIVVPLSQHILPGWTVAGALLDDTGSMATGKTFFLASATLVALFVLTILAGSSLLLRQARLSEIESLQKTSFVANVSHELKTPLTSIRLHAELLEQNRVRDEQQRANFLGAIGRETQRLTRLVNNVLDFSRLEQGRRKFSKHTIDLGEKLSELLDSHAPRVADAGLQIKRHLPAAPVQLCTDADAIDQIILNLIDNACKYAASGGELEVSLLHNANTGAVEIRVGDRGPGIPASHRKRIFDKFHRVDNTLTSEQSGAGLGLSIARQLARALGGELRHENRSGGGSEFILTLKI